MTSFANSLGSIVVDYRVTWDNETDLSGEIIMDILCDNLNNNSSYFESYLIPAESLEYTNVVDICATEPNALS